MRLSVAHPLPLRYSEFSVVSARVSGVVLGEMNNAVNTPRPAAAAKAQGGKKQNRASCAICIDFDESPVSVAAETAVCDIVIPLDFILPLRWHERL